MNCIAIQYLYENGISTAILDYPTHQCISVFRIIPSSHTQICVNLFGYLGYAGRKGGHSNVVVSVVRLNLLV